MPHRNGRTHQGSPTSSATGRETPNRTSTSPVGCSWLSCGGTYRIIVIVVHSGHIAWRVRSVWFGCEFVTTKHVHPIIPHRSDLCLKLADFMHTSCACVSYYLYVTYAFLRFTLEHKCTVCMPFLGELFQISFRREPPPWTFRFHWGNRILWHDVLLLC